MSNESKANIKKTVLITTIPFGEGDRTPLDLMEQEGIKYVINPIGRKIKEDELADLIEDYSVLIAGTEPITTKVMDRAPNLRMISRVGIGVDNVDLVAARQRGILVSNTPEAPAPAIAELTIGFMLSLLRLIPQSDRNIRNGVWQKIMGRRLSEMTVGVIGVGRVGKRVIQLLAGFGSSVMAYDTVPDLKFGTENNVCWADKEVIYREADIITLHLPMTPLTKNLITHQEIAMMKPDVLLINTSRGNMIDEHGLTMAIQDNRVGGAAIDVFAQEPYSGELAKLERCVLTPHIGSMSRDCRNRMELEATEEVIRFFRGEPLRQLVQDTL